MSIFMTSRLHRKLQLLQEAGYSTTLSLNKQEIEHARHSDKTTIPAQNIVNLGVVDEPVELVLPFNAYKVVLGLPLLRGRNPEIDRSLNHCVHLPNPAVCDWPALWTPNSVNLTAMVLALGHFCSPHFAITLLGSRLQGIALL